MKLSKTLITVLVIVGIIGIFILFAVGKYNSIVSGEEKVSQSWAQVENVYQRRAQLIPNLVKTVQGAANFEKSTLEGVIQARSDASSIKLDPSKMTEADFAKYQQAQDKLTSALSRLMVVVEKYPELKAVQNFSELQAEIAGSENRITVERKKFNEAVQEYNVLIRRFPGNIVASLFGFSAKPYFKASAGAENAPEVNFNF